MGNLLIISYFIFLFSMVTCFFLNITNVLKWGQNASLRTTITIFSDLKRIMMVKEIPRKFVIYYIEITPNDL